MTIDPSKFLQSSADGLDRRMRKLRKSWREDSLPFKNIELIIGKAYLYAYITSSIHLIRKFGKLALTIERHALFETSFISTVLFTGETLFCTIIRSWHPKIAFCLGR